MREMAIAAVVLSASTCASAPRTPPPPPDPFRYVFSNALPAETRVCVTRTPFVDLSCMPLAELRAWLRRRQLARFEGHP